MHWLVTDLYSVSLACIILFHGIDENIQCIHKNGKLVGVQGLDIRLALSMHTLGTSAVVVLVAFVALAEVFGLGGGWVLILLIRYIISRSSFLCCSSNWYDRTGGST